MTPKAKAKAIFKKYAKGKDEQGWYLTEFDSCAKICALIAVDELIYETQFEVPNIRQRYWQEVKQEIEKL